MNDTILLVSSCIIYDIIYYITSTAWYIICSSYRHILTFGSFLRSHVLYFYLCWICDIPLKILVSSFLHNNNLFGPEQDQSLSW